jgi:excisionase family DNA binding protein
VEDELQLLREERMITTHDGITVERKTDGSVAIHISADILRPKNIQADTISAAKERVQKQALQIPDLPQSAKPKRNNVALATMTKLERYLTVQDVSQILQLSQRTVWRLIAGEHFPHHRIGTRVRFLVDEIEDWLEKQNRRR